MSTQRSMLHVRMDTDLKRKATETLAEIGLSPSDAVRLLFHRIAADQAFPFELKVPNAQTQKGHGRGRRDGEDAQSAIRERGPGVCGT